MSAQVSLMYVWRPDPNPAWRVITAEERVEGRVCNQRHCERPAVAVLMRSAYRHGSGYHYRRWFCCDDHMYGRRIVCGEVYHRVRIQREESALA